jgi:hypothetical protein
MPGRVANAIRPAIQDADGRRDRASYSDTTGATMLAMVDDRGCRRVILYKR